MASVLLCLRNLYTALLPLFQTFQPRGAVVSFAELEMDISISVHCGYWLLDHALYEWCMKLEARCSIHAVFDPLRRYVMLTCDALRKESRIH
jgi:hypothetical protein